jgi:hypothetical protein
MSLPLLRNFEMVSESNWEHMDYAGHLSIHPLLRWVLISRQHDPTITEVIPILFRDYFIIVTWLAEIDTCATPGRSFPQIAGFCIRADTGRSGGFIGIVKNPVTRSFFNKCRFLKITAIDLDSNWILQESWPKSLSIHREMSVRDLVNIAGPCFMDRQLIITDSLDGNCIST